MKKNHNIIRASKITNSVLPFSIGLLVRKKVLLFSIGLLVRKEGRLVGQPVKKKMTYKYTLCVLIEMKENPILFLYANPCQYLRMLNSPVIGIVHIVTF